MVIPELNKVYTGDCLATMRGWPDEFVDCTVTSPPYFDLRSYLPKDHPDKAKEIGCTNNLGAYLHDLLHVFGEVLRLTKPSGSLWLNMGDTFKDGEALQVPYLLSSSMKRLGWHLVSEVIWFKPNCIPTVNQGRPIPSHEYVFQFAKTRDYYFDRYPLMEPSKYQHDPSRELKSHARSVWTIPTVSLNGRKLMADFKEDGMYKQFDPNCEFHWYGPGPLFQHDKVCICKPVEVDFFAAMPPELARRCIVASTSDIGNCGNCGAPPRRVLKKDRVATRPGLDVKVDPCGKANKDGKRHVTYVKHDGWEPTCSCSLDCQADARDMPVVFDCFMGSGTTALAATMTGRQYLGCELNEVMVNRLIPARLKAAFRGKR